MEQQVRANIPTCSCRCRTVSVVGYDCVSDLSTDLGILMDCILHAVTGNKECGLREWIAATGSGYSPMASCCMYGKELLGYTVSTVI